MNSNHHEHFTVSCFYFYFHILLCRLCVTHISQPYSKVKATQPSTDHLIINRRAHTFFLFLPHLCTKHYFYRQMMMNYANKSKKELWMAGWCPNAEHCMQKQLPHKMCDLLVCNNINRLMTVSVVWWAMIHLHGNLYAVGCWLLFLLFAFRQRDRWVKSV